MNSRTFIVVCAMLLGSISLIPAAELSAEEDADTDNATATTAVAVTNIHNATDVEKQVRTLFEETPVMAEIARCESKFRQYTDSGNTLRGGSGGKMIGVFQFHEDFHTVQARTLGYDIFTLGGNLGYAKYVYTNSGTGPWMSSFSCWNQADTSVPAENAGTSGLSANLRFGQSHAEVRTLQQILNRAGFTIAESGPGSPGNETTMFGNLTRAAVKKFQCAQQIACDGDEYSTGYGYVGAKTRAALSAHLAQKGSNSQTVAETSAKKFSKNTNTVSSADDDVNRTALLAKIAELIRLIAELQAKLALMNA